MPSTKFARGEQIEKLVGEGKREGSDKIQFIIDLRKY